MELELERDDYRLRLLIEQLQHEGRNEHEIERAVREASGRMRRERPQPARESRFGLISRLLPL